MHKNTPYWFRLGAEAWKFPPYAEPLGLPAYWDQEQTGILRAVVQDYHERPHVPPLLLAYLRYVIAAPCWDRNPDADAASRAQLATLRRRAQQMQTAAEVEQWLADCLEVGLDLL